MKKAGPPTSRWRKYDSSPPASLTIAKEHVALLARLAERHGRAAIAEAARAIVPRGAGRVAAAKRKSQAGAPSWPKSRDVKYLNGLVLKYGPDVIAAMALQVPLPKRGRPYNARPLYERIHLAQLFEEWSEDNRANGSKRAVRDVEDAFVEMVPCLYLDLLHPDIEDTLRRKYCDHNDPMLWEARRLRAIDIYWLTRADRLIDPDLDPRLWKLLRQTRPHGDPKRQSKAERNAAKFEFETVRQGIIDNYLEALKKRRTRGKQERAALPVTQNRKASNLRS